MFIWIIYIDTRSTIADNWLLFLVFQRIETAAKKARLLEEKRLKREQKIREKLENMWRSKGYTSRNLPLDSENESDTDEEEDDVTEDNLTTDFQDIKYVSGDVSMPKTQDGDSIIVHCVGNFTVNYFYLNIFD